MPGEVHGHLVLHPGPEVLALSPGHSEVLPGDHVEGEVVQVGRGRVPVGKQGLELEEPVAGGKLGKGFRFGSIILRGNTSLLLHPSQSVAENIIRVSLQHDH